MKLNSNFWYCASFLVNTFKQEYLLHIPRLLWYQPISIKDPAISESFLRPCLWYIPEQTALGPWFGSFMCSYVPATSIAGDPGKTASLGQPWDSSSGLWTGTNSSFILLYTTLRMETSLALISLLDWDQADIFIEFIENSMIVQKKNGNCPTYVVPVAISGQPPT